MRVLLWHGYLLSGSGSNLYTANLARTWRAQGHDVLLMCQERKVEGLGFIDEHGDFDPGNSKFTATATGVAAADGRCRLVRPSIGKVLPVYVFDEYEGFTAKRFVDLTDDELQTYTDANISALVTAIESHRPDALVTGHEVMGPYIALKACEVTGNEYLAKLHGSALEYAVKEQERYRGFAREGLMGAKVVTGGSEYMIREASSVIPGWEERAVVVNPGCDVDLFMPRRSSKGEGAVVGYVGKLIASKGVHHLLAAFGLLKTDDVRGVIIGYGGFEQQLKQLWEALRRGDEEGVRASARDAGGRMGEALLKWVDEGGLTPDYVERVAKFQCEWPGRLDHDELSQVLPDYDVIVVPSVVPEAFGMVGAEAAASGVLPIVPGHSGIGEIGRALEEEFGLRGLLTFEPERPIEGIADALDRVLALPRQQRGELGLAAADLARRLWSWEGVADRLLALASN